LQKPKEKIMRVQSASELAVRVAQDPNLQQEIKDDPVNALANLAAPLESDVWIYRTVVVALGLTVLLAMVGSIVLGFKNMAFPDASLALGSAAVGALAGLLAPAPGNRG
jgi:hypothetical protein